MAQAIKGVPLNYLGRFTVATLPTTATYPQLEVGDMSFATNGRKDAEGAAAGTGVPCFYDGTAWRRTTDGTTVAA